MNIRFNIEKNQRKALAQKIGELAEMDVRYCGVPSCAYEIGAYTLDKEAVHGDAYAKFITMFCEFAKNLQRVARDGYPPNGGNPPHTSHVCGSCAMYNSRTIHLHFCFGLLAFPFYLWYTISI
ncbi:hypothetical protein [Ruminococcus sp. HUN007]|uniref:hypothetical protein n=1 Tax=Ruminococcus sp. HUN007 TaxID=1514668 RepID=UPI0005D18709|nr:hypothetical protein [Ruminococcus sp. HUN007]